MGSRDDREDTRDAGIFRTSIHQLGIQGEIEGMTFGERIHKIFYGVRDDKEMENWFLTLAPIAVAFIFFFIFMMPLHIQDKDLILVVGAGAGLSGLQAYWIYRGWIRADGMTLLQGILGLAAVVAATWAYVTIFRDMIIK